MKVCTKCGKEKPIESFNKDVTRTDGRYPQCKTCRKDSRNPEKYKNWELKKTYGITLDDFNTMMQCQHDCCAICSRNFSEVGVVPCVDHCHETGDVRGLLCRSCNTLLGQANDSIPTLLSAVSYLHESQKG